MIVKRKNKAGGVFYFDTNTKKFASKSQYDSGLRKKASGAVKSITRAASKSACSTLGKALKTTRTSAAGRGLRCKCNTNLPRCRKG